MMHDPAEEGLPPPTSLPAGTLPPGAAASAAARPTRAPAAVEAGRPAVAKGPTTGTEGAAVQYAAVGMSLFWRFWQLATSAIALGVMCSADQNGLTFLNFQAYVWLVTAMAVVIAWAVYNMAHDVSELLPKSVRRWLFLITEFNVAWIALAGAAAAAGLTTFADRGAGLVQPGYCQIGSYFHSICARTKAATAMAFLAFFVFIPTIISSTARTIADLRGVQEDTAA